MDVSKKMPIEECIFGRRTIRQYTDKSIPQDVLDKILEAGLYAPSACNFQAWKIIVVNEEKIKKDVIALYGKKSRGGVSIIEACRQFLVMTYRNDLDVSGRIVGDYIQSAAAAIQNMLLMAYSYGIGCCWICDLPKVKEVRHVLNIPDNYDVIAFVSLGYPKGSVGSCSESQIYHYGSEENFRKHKRRYTKEQFISYNSFMAVEGDSTYGRYPQKSLRNTLYKRFPFLDKIRNAIKRLF